MCAHIIKTLMTAKVLIIIAYSLNSEVVSYVSIINFQY